MVVLVTLFATLTAYDTVLEAKVGASFPAEAVRLLNVASLLFGYTYAPISQLVPLVFWLSVIILDGQVEAGSRPHSYVEPRFTPASMAGEVDWRVKSVGVLKRVEALVNLGSDCTELVLDP